MAAGLDGAAAERIAADAGGDCELIERLLRNADALAPRGELRSLGAYLTAGVRDRYPLRPELAKADAERQAKEAKVRRERATLHQRHVESVAWVRSLPDADRLRLAESAIAYARRGFAARLRDGTPLGDYLDTLHPEDAQFAWYIRDCVLRGAIGTSADIAAANAFDPKLADPASGKPRLKFHGAPGRMRA